MEWPTSIWFWISAYAVVINSLAYTAMAADKSSAKKGKRRIPEKRLFTIALLGGALGMFIGMQRLRHKTKHLSFRLLLPLFILGHMVLLGLLIYPIL